MCFHKLTHSSWQLNLCAASVSYEDTAYPVWFARPYRLLPVWSKCGERLQKKPCIFARTALNSYSFYMDKAKTVQCDLLSIPVECSICFYGSTNTWPCLLGARGISGLGLRGLLQFLLWRFLQCRLRLCRSHGIPCQRFLLGLYYLVELDTWKMYILRLILLDVYSIFFTFAL